MVKKSKTEATDKDRTKSAVPSVQKAFDILEVLAESRDGLTINEMLDVLDRTMGEIYRIVIYLAERGYLAQNPDTNRYALTLKLFELSHRHDPTERLIRNAVPMLERIAENTQQSCHLGVLNKGNVLVLASVPSPRPAGYSVRTGSIFPIDRTSSGHVILAFSDQETQQRYLTSVPSCDREAVQARLENICKQGFEDTASTMILGVRNLCVPVFDSGGISGAVTSGFIEQTGETPSAEIALKTLTKTAFDLSQSLGFQVKQSDFAEVLAP